MKKRKSPIALVSVLIICMIAVALMAVRVEGGDDEKEVGQKALPTPEMKDMVKKGPGRGANLGNDDPRMIKNDEMANAGSVVKMKPEGAYKARPNESQGQGQWYTPEAHQATPK